MVGTTEPKTMPFSKIQDKLDSTCLHLYPALSTLFSLTVKYHTPLQTETMPRQLMGYTYQNICQFS